MTVTFMYMYRQNNYTYTYVTMLFNKISGVTVFTTRDINNSNSKCTEMVSFSKDGHINYYVHVTVLLEYNDFDLFSITKHYQADVFIIMYLTYLSA